MRLQACDVTELLSPSVVNTSRSDRPIFANAPRYIPLPFIAALELWLAPPAAGSDGGIFRCFEGHLIDLTCIDRLWVLKGWGGGGGLERSVDHFGTVPNRLLAGISGAGPHVSRIDKAFTGVKPVITLMSSV